MKKLTTILVVFALTGCSLNPVRLFQAKVPAPVTKPDTQLESERQSAKLIADNVEKPEELKPVARGLSQSLGEPKKPLVVKKAGDLPVAAAAATKNMDAQLLAMQRQITELNKLLVKYQGKEIEGTGFSILGPSMTIIVIGLIVLAVACPPALTLMIFAYKRLKAAAGIVVNEVEAASKAPETQAAVAKIKENIGEAMVAAKHKTTLLKDTITNLKTA